MMIPTIEVAISLFPVNFLFRFHTAQSEVRALYQGSITAYNHLSRPHCGNGAVRSFTEVFSMRSCRKEEGSFAKHIGQVHGVRL